MSHVQKALDAIKLAAAEPGVAGIGDIAQRAGINVDVARRLVKKPPTAVDNLKALEVEAAKILGDRAS